MSRIRAPALVRREPWLAALTAVTACCYAAFSVVRHLHYGSFAFDLGIFDQAIWHYSRFEVPETTIVGLPSILGDHVSPILLLLVPLYWVWADPIMLLVAQGALIAASIVPVFGFCADRVGRLPAYLLAAAYSLFWAVHAAVIFDFHEVAFAPLLIALILRAVDRERWRSYAVLVGLLLLVKEDLAVLVAFLGLYLIALRHWRAGLLTAGAGLGWFLVATKVVIPIFSGGREFRHWSYGAFGTGMLDAIGNIARDPLFALGSFVDSNVKLRTLAYLFAPFLGLVLASPLLILCVPLLAERMLSSNPAHWGTSAHYSLTIAPIVVMGCADGLARVLRALGSPRRRAAAATACAGVALAANLAVAWSSGLNALGDPAFYRASAYERTVSRALDAIPPTASVMAESRFVPHLSQREEIFQLAPGPPRADYVVADAGDYFRILWPEAGYVDRRRMLLDYGRTHVPVFVEDDVVVLARRALAGKLASAGPE